MTKAGYIALVIFGLIIMTPCVLVMAALSGSMMGRWSELALPMLLLTPVFGLMVALWGLWSRVRKSMATPASRLLIAIGLLTLLPGALVIINVAASSELNWLAPLYLVPFCGAFLIAWGARGLVRALNEA